MAEQELTNVIDNFEKQLSLLRKAIKKESVKRSTADKIVLNIYNAVGDLPIKKRKTPVDYIGHVKKKLEILIKEIDKALKNKKLYSEKLKNMNDYFKSVIEGLDLIIDEEIGYYMREKIDKSVGNPFGSNCFGSDFNNNIATVVDDSKIALASFKKISKTSSEDEKVVFISKMFKVASGLRKVCKTHLNSKRSENNQLNMSKSKEVSKNLAKLRRKVSKNSKYMVGQVGNSGGYTATVSAKIINDEVKKVILEEYQPCKENLSSWIGESKIKCLKKYLGKNELKNFILTKQKFENILDNLCR